MWRLQSSRPHPGENKVGVAQTLYYVTQITTVLGGRGSAGQGKSILKLSFHSPRRGCVGAAVEKRVISTTAGEQKAAWYRREEKRRRNSDAGPEGTSEWPTLRGWGGLPVLFYRNFAADTDYPITPRQHWKEGIRRPETWFLKHLERLHGKQGWRCQAALAVATKETSPLVVPNNSAAATGLSGKKTVIFTARCRAMTARYPNPSLTCLSQSSFVGSQFPLSAALGSGLRDSVVWAKFYWKISHWLGSARSRASPTGLFLAHLPMWRIEKYLLPSG